MNVATLLLRCSRLRPAASANAAQHFTSAQPLLIWEPQNESAAYPQGEIEAKLGDDIAFSPHMSDQPSHHKPGALFVREFLTDATDSSRRCSECPR